MEYYPAFMPGRGPESVVSVSGAGDRYVYRVMRKASFGICKNKGADQLRNNCTAVQGLCFCYIDSTIRLLPKTEIAGL